MNLFDHPLGKTAGVEGKDGEKMVLDSRLLHRVQADVDDMGQQRALGNISIIHGSILP